MGVESDDDTINMLRNKFKITQLEGTKNDDLILAVKRNKLWVNH